MAGKLLVFGVCWFLATFSVVGDARLVNQQAPKSGSFYMIAEKELLEIEDVLNGEGVFPDDAVLRLLRRRLPKLISEIRAEQGDGSTMSIHQHEETIPPQYICMTCKTVIGPVWDDGENQCECDVYKFEVWRVAPTQD